MDKEYIARRVNKNCTRSSCLMCAEADKYPSYMQCPYLPLKEIAVLRPLTASDISDEFIGTEAVPHES